MLDLWGIHGLVQQGRGWLVVLWQTSGMADEAFSKPESHRVPSGGYLPPWSLNPMANH